MVFADQSDLRTYYERGEELDRLDAPVGRLELVRTQEILQRALPAPGATVADMVAWSGQGYPDLAGYRGCHGRANGRAHGRGCDGAGYRRRYR